TRREPGLLKTGPISRVHNVRTATQRNSMVTISCGWEPGGGLRQELQHIHNFSRDSNSILRGISGFPGRGKSRCAKRDWLRAFEVSVPFRAPTPSRSSCPFVEWETASSVDANWFQ